MEMKNNKLRMKNEKVVTVRIYLMCDGNNFFIPFSFFILHFYISLCVIMRFHSSIPKSLSCTSLP